MRDRKEFDMGEKLIDGELSLYDVRYENGLAYLVDKNGDVISKGYEGISFNDKLSVYIVKTHESKYNFIPVKGRDAGKLISQGNFDLMNFVDYYTADAKTMRMAVHQEGKGWTFIKEGGVLFNDWFSSVGPFKMGQSRVSKEFYGGKGKSKEMFNFVNWYGKLLLDQWVDGACDFKDELAMVYRWGRGYGYVNLSGEMLTDKMYVKAKEFKGGFGMVYDSQGWHYINKLGHVSGGFDELYEPRNSVGIGVKQEGMDSRYYVINVKDLDFVGAKEIVI